MKSNLNYNLVEKEMDKSDWIFLHGGEKEIDINEWDMGRNLTLYIVRRKVKLYRKR